MLVGKYAGQITLDDCTYTAQDLVKLLAERDALVKDLVSEVVKRGRIEGELRRFRRIVTESLADLQHIPHAMLMVLRPEGECQLGCPRCLINKVTHAVNTA